MAAARKVVTTGTAANSGSRGALPRCRTVWSRRRDRRASSAPRGRPSSTTGSSAAMMATAPVWPVTPRRIAACTRFDAKACRKAASACSSGTPCAPARRRRRHSRACPRQGVDERVRPAGSGGRKAGPCRVVSTWRSAEPAIASASSATSARSPPARRQASANSTASFQPEPMSRSDASQSRRSSGPATRPVVDGGFQPVAVGESRRPERPATARSSAAAGRCRPAAQPWLWP